MPPDFIGQLLKKGKGPRIMTTANQDMAAINAKRCIEGRPPCKHITPHNVCYYMYGFHALEYGKAHEGYWDGYKMLELVNLYML